MHRLDVTHAVWDRVLAMRSGTALACSGTWSAAEHLALDLYTPLVAHANTPFVFAQVGQSLDGRVATQSGDAKDISGPDGFAHLHRLRALADAVVIGVKTALHDDPQLTVRLARGDNPARVIIDPDGRLPDDSKVLRDPTARRIVIQAVDRPRPDGVEVIHLPRADWIAASDIVTALHNLGLNRLLIEGGGITIAQFLEANLLSRLHVAVAPLLIGSGQQGLNLGPVATLAQARRLDLHPYNLGSDVVFDCALQRGDSV